MLPVWNRSIHAFRSTRSPPNRSTALRHTYPPSPQLWFFRELSVTGTRSTLLDTLQSLAESAASAVLLAVLLFAALGWSLTRESLSRRELQLSAVVFGVFAAIALVQALCSARDGGRDNDVCKVYLLTEYVIRSAVMLGVVVALNFTIAQLRLALTEARWDHRVTPISYMKLRQFQYVVSCGGLSSCVCVWICGRLSRSKRVTESRWLIRGPALLLELSACLAGYERLRGNECGHWTNPVLTQQALPLSVPRLLALPDLSPARPCA